MSGIIAIVGRPNVGKSALFNRLAGRRIAIVHDEPGVTRDRVSAETEWRGKSFTVVDTGGLGLLRGEKAGDVIARAALEQVQLAIDAADVILFVVDVREGIVPLDLEVAQRLRRSGKPVLVAANKADHDGFDIQVADFARLGFEQVFPISAIHDRGFESLLQSAVAFLPEPPGPEATAGSAVETPALKLALVGRPNVGKSSLLNALIGSERVLVTPVPGTTRDAVDVPFEIGGDGIPQKCILIDTAGVRKTRRIDTSVEFFSVRRTEDAIARCDLVLLILDAEAGVAEQDKKIADQIVDLHKACILVVNKWDLVAPGLRQARRAPSRRPAGARARSQPDPSLAAFAQWLQRTLFFLDYCPVIFISAKSGFHLDRLLEAIRYVAAQLRQKVPTALLNRAIRDAVERRQPVTVAGHRLKFFYATQTAQSPPTFLLFVNRPDLLSEPYRRYLTGELRRGFGFEGCPIVLIAKPRPKAGVKRGA